jgi:hypothetical protein
MRETIRKKVREAEEDVQEARDVDPPPVPSPLTTFRNQTLQFY